jgi:hypothetical protein
MDFYSIKCNTVHKLLDSSTFIRRSCTDVYLQARSQAPLLFILKQFVTEIEIESTIDRSLIVEVVEPANCP